MHICQDYISIFQRCRQKKTYKNFGAFSTFKGYTIVTLSEKANKPKTIFFAIFCPSRKMEVVVWCIHLYNIIYVSIYYYCNKAICNMINVMAQKNTNIYIYNHTVHCIYIREGGNIALDSIHFNLLFSPKSLGTFIEF